MSEILYKTIHFKRYGFNLFGLTIFWYSPSEQWSGIEIHWKGLIVWDWTLYDWSEKFPCEFCGKSDCDECEFEFNGELDLHEKK